MLKSLLDFFTASPEDDYTTVVNQADQTRVDYSQDGTVVYFSSRDGKERKKTYSSSGQVFGVIGSGTIGNHFGSGESQSFASIGDVTLTGKIERGATINLAGAGQRTISRDVPNQVTISLDADIDQLTFMGKVADDVILKATSPVTLIFHQKPSQTLFDRLKGLSLFTMLVKTFALEATDNQPKPPKPAANADSNSSETSTFTFNGPGQVGTIVPNKGSSAKFNFRNSVTENGVRLTQEEVKQRLEGEHQHLPKYR